MHNISKIISQMAVAREAEAHRADNLVKHLTNDINNLLFHFRVFSDQEIFICLATD